MSEEFDLNAVYLVGEIAVLKLISGEEVIVTVKLITPYTIVCANPLALVYMPQDRSNSMVVRLMPFMYYSKDHVIFNTSTIMCKTTPANELKDEYTRATSLILTPPQSDLTLNLS